MLWSGLVGFARLVEEGLALGLV